MSLDVDTQDVPATPTLFDVLPVRISLTKVFGERAVEIRLRVAVYGMRDKIHVVASGRLFDGVDRMLDEEGLVVFVLWFFQVRGPRIVVRSVGDGRRIAVVVGMTRHDLLLDGEQHKRRGNYQLARFTPTVRLLFPEVFDEIAAR